MDKIPKITYKKWYHRLNPYYRRRIKLMNILIKHNWENGMEEEVYNKVKNRIIYGHY